MIRIYTWKHLGIAFILTIGLCIGILSYSKWEVNRFNDSLETVDPNTLNQLPRISNKPIEKIQKNPKLRAATNIIDETEDIDLEEVNTNSDNVNNESLVDDVVEENQELEDEETAFSDFLAYLDELEQEEFDTLLANLEITDIDEEDLNTVTENGSENLSTLITQESEEQEEQNGQEDDDDDIEDDIENVNPNRLVLDLIDSGVVSLDSLISLMEESSADLPELTQDRFQPVLGTLRTMQENGGRVVVHRPTENPSDWRLLFINPVREFRTPRFPIGLRRNGRVEFVPLNPRDRYIILDDRNSTIID
ncbi:hypothetical protein JT359_11965 [Candidatus Poribacteria bacterium]|nr:hypothetical protein [Candidatus Poribacteria bacterium]